MMRSTCPRPIKHDNLHVACGARQFRAHAVALDLDHGSTAYWRPKQFFQRIRTPSAACSGDATLQTAATATMVFAMLFMKSPNQRHLQFTAEGLLL